MEKNLVLYVLPGCPYCAKVLSFMDKNGIDIPIKSTSDPQAREELIKVGGKMQAPCLFIDGKAMYESDDIISYLKSQLA